MSFISRTIELDFSTSDEDGWFNYELLIECDIDDDAWRSFSIWRKNKEDEQEFYDSELEGVKAERFGQYNRQFKDLDTELQRRIKKCLDEIVALQEEIDCRCESCREWHGDTGHRYIYYNKHFGEGA